MHKLGCVNVSFNTIPLPFTCAGIKISLLTSTLRYYVSNN